MCYVFYLALLAYLFVFTPSFSRYSHIYPLSLDRHVKFTLLANKLEFFSSFVFHTHIHVTTNGEKQRLWIWLSWSPLIKLENVPGKNNHNVSISNSPLLLTYALSLSISSSGRAGIQLFINPLDTNRTTLNHCLCQHYWP